MRYIQIGQTALRDPVTGEFLPAVPLYIREKDREACGPTILIDEGKFQREMAEKFVAYKREEKKAKNKEESNHDAAGHNQGDDERGLQGAFHLRILADEDKVRALEELLRSYRSGGLDA